VPYPAANAPQAWASGAVIYLIETLLGVTVRNDKLSTRPLAGDLARLHLQGVRFRGMRLEL
jgi:glycogen debranching enzyme